MGGGAKALGFSMLFGAAVLSGCTSVLQAPEAPNPPRALPEGEPVFREARAPSRDELQGLLDKIIARLMNMLTRQGYLVEERLRW